MLYDLTSGVTHGQSFLQYPMSYTSQPYSVWAGTAQVCNSQEERITETHMEASGLITMKREEPCGPLVHTPVIVCASYCAGPWACRGKGSRFGLSQTEKELQPLGEQSPVGHTGMNKATKL